MGPSRPGAASAWRALISTINAHATAESGRPPPREAQLKAHYAGLYPGLPAAVWLDAAEVVARAAPQRRRAQATPVLRQRLLPEEHFEFRGGERRGQWWLGVLSRATDPWVYETD